MKLSFSYIPNKRSGSKRYRHRQVYLCVLRPFAFPLFSNFLLQVPERVFPRQMERVFFFSFVPILQSCTLVDRKTYVMVQWWPKNKPKLKWKFNLWKWNGNFRSSWCERKKWSASESRPFVLKISVWSARFICISCGWTENFCEWKVPLISPVFSCIPLLLSPTLLFWNASVISPFSGILKYYSAFPCNLPHSRVFPCILLGKQYASGPGAPWGRRILD